MVDISHIAHEHYPLRKVLMHRPEVELAAVTDDTLDFFHFSAVPDIDRFLAEFDALVGALEALDAMRTISAGIRGKVGGTSWTSL